MSTERLLSGCPHSILSRGKQTSSATGNQEQVPGSLQNRNLKNGNPILGKFYGVEEYVSTCCLYFSQCTHYLLKAGAGKTVLTFVIVSQNLVAADQIYRSLVINHLEVSAQHNNFGIAFLYLNHKESEAQTLANVLGSLWSQLMLGKTMPTAVHSLYAHHQERNTRPSLEELQKVLISATAQYSRVYFIIDALDEYPEEKHSVLLEYLGANTCNINLMITSRPHITMDLFFTDLKILEIYATNEDISKYVNHRILKSVRLLKHTRTHPELLEEIQDKIISNAEGM
jgi:hypothetical protein